MRVQNRAIEKYYVQDGEILRPAEGPSHDSVWSFHVWTEMFMKRPMLNQQLGRKKAANGWQAVDATPQELSRGGSGITPAGGAVYQMGPASLKLLKRNTDPRGNRGFVRVPDSSRIAIPAMIHSLGCAPAGA